MTGYTQHATVRVTGTSWEEKRVAEAGPAHAVASAVYTTTFAGDIDGESTCALLIAYVDGDLSDPHSLRGPYTGYEQVSGTLAGRSGTFVLAATGEHSGGVARTEVQVVPESGTGELSGLRGAGSYQADAMDYTLRLDYDVE